MNVTKEILLAYIKDMANFRHALKEAHKQVIAVVPKHRTSNDRQWSCGCTVHPECSDTCMLHQLMDLLDVHYSYPYDDLP